MKGSIVTVLWNNFPNLSKCLNWMVMSVSVRQMFRTNLIIWRRRMRSATHMDRRNTSDSPYLKASKCHLAPVSCSFWKDNKCSVNAERMRCKCTLRRRSASPDVFLAAAVSQLCAAPWCWEAGDGCLVTKYLVCSLFSGFWPSLSTPLWGERRWIGAPGLSARSREKRLTDGC